MVWFSVLLLFLPQAAAAAPVPVVPEAPGVYYRQDDANWNNLKPAVTSNAETKGLKLFVESGGYTDLGINITCRGARASVRMQVGKPTLYVREIGAAKDAIIIRLTRKKDSRVFKTAFSDVTVQNKGGFRKEDIHKLNVVEYPDGSFSVTPEKELDPGEYLLVFGNSPGGYDFGIDKAK
jgi:hypothetical protein